MEEPEKKTRKKSGSEERIKVKILGFRAQPLEAIEIEAAARDRGLTVSSYIRDTMLQDVRTKPRRRPLVDITLLTKLVAGLGKVGSNLNQIARHLNEGGAVSAARTNSVLQEVEDLIREIIAAIRRPYDNQRQEQGSAERTSGLPPSDTGE